MKIIFTVIFALIFTQNGVSCLSLSEYAKFCGIRVIVVFVVFRAIVPPCLRGSPKFFLKGISLVQNLFSWVFHGSKIFSLSVFRGSKIFPCKYFVGPKYFSVVIFWVRNSFSCVFCGPNISSPPFHMKTSRLIYTVNRVTSFYMQHWAHKD